jgi:nucleoside permease NupC
MWAGYALSPDEAWLRRDRIDGATSSPKARLIIPLNNRAHDTAVVALCVAFPLGFGALALVLGQDTNYDLRNYHWYKPYAFLTGGLLSTLVPPMGTLSTTRCSMFPSICSTKTVLNELVAYLDLARLPKDSLSERSTVIMTYALCGFANLGSLGILIGGLGTMVPDRRAEVIALGPKSIVSGRWQRY